MATTKQVLSLLESNLYMTDGEICKALSIASYPLMRLVRQNKIKMVMAGKGHYFLGQNFSKLPLELQQARKIEIPTASLPRLGQPKQREHPYYFNHYRTLEQRKEYDRRRSELRRQFDPGFKQLQASYRRKYKDYKKQVLLELSEKILAEMLQEGEKVTAEKLQDSFNNALKCTE